MTEQAKRPTIARIWRGRSRPEVADAYEAYNYEVGIKPLIEKAMGVQTFREDREGARRDCCGPGTSSHGGGTPTAGSRFHCQLSRRSAARAPGSGARAGAGSAGTPAGRASAGRG